MTPKQIRQIASILTDDPDILLEYTSPTGETDEAWKKRIEGRSSWETKHDHNLTPEEKKQKQQETTVGGLFFRMDRVNNTRRLVYQVKTFLLKQMSREQQQGEPTARAEAARSYNETIKYFEGIQILFDDWLDDPSVTLKLAEALINLSKEMMYLSDRNEGAASEARNGLRQFARGLKRFNYYMQEDPRVAEVAMTSREFKYSK